MPSMDGTRKIYEAVFDRVEVADADVLVLMAMRAARCGEHWRRRRPPCVPNGWRDAMGA